MSRFHRLLASSGAAHFADQAALAALPLTAVLLLDAGPRLVGTLVAIQGAAWLFVSLPGGVIADRMSRSRLIGLSQAGAAIAFMAACAAALSGWWIGFGVLILAGASGYVLAALASLSLVPALVPKEQLARANGKLELTRAIATLAAPAIVGLVAARASPAFGFGLAAAAALAAAVAGFRIESPAPRATARPPVWTAIREGAAFTLRHELLRGIVLCAVFWNFAFFALLAVVVPFGLHRVGLDPRMMGLAQSGNGLGLMVGAAVGGRLLARWEPRVILVLGPALSLLAAALLLAAPAGGGFAAVFASFFLLGFGPMLWLICQTSIRQIVTPAALLGRVAALVQVAIYGVRPVGALAGGWAAAAGLDAALVLVMAGFALSAAVPFLSALGQLRILPEPQAS